MRFRHCSQAFRACTIPTTTWLATGSCKFRLSARLSGESPDFCALLWVNELLHHFETIENHCLFVFTGEASHQGFLGGAKWISSIHSIHSGSEEVSHRGDHQAGTQLRASSRGQRGVTSQRAAPSVSGRLRPGGHRFLFSDLGAPFGACLFQICCHSGGWVKGKQKRKRTTFGGTPIYIYIYIESSPFNWVCLKEAVSSWNKLLVDVVGGVVHFEGRQSNHATGLFSLGNATLF